MRRILQKAPGAPKCRTNLVAIGGASLSWHNLESYFRPNAIGSYSFSSDGNNTVVFRDPSEQLWDSVLLLDSTQGPIHPQLKENFRQFGKKMPRFAEATTQHRFLLFPGLIAIARK